jgi:replicative DNA helicase
MPEPDSSVPAERSLPHNLEAERSVLGAILIHNDAFNQAAELLDSEDFFRDAHRRVFDKMVNLNERGDAIDLVTLKDELGRSGDLDAVGGPTYIASLVDGVPRSTHVEYYAQIVKEKATLRSLIFSANRILDTAYNAEEDADALLDTAEQEIFSIADENLHTGFVPLRALVQDSFDTIEKLQQHKGVVTGVPSGFDDLDKLTSGFQPSDLVIIAARPSMGKTAFVLNIAQYLGVQSDKSIGVFSLEMSKEQLFMRMLTTEAQIDSQKFRGAFLSEREYGELSAALGRLGDAKVFIDDSASIGVLEMRAKSRRLKSEHGLDLIIVDYIQLMQGRGRFENRTLELAAISRSLKGLAKELSVPVIVLSQLSRATESRSDRRPQLSDLRESGALEQDADLVMFIYREEMYERTPEEKKPENENMAEVIIGKQRNGPTGIVKLAFLKQQTRFANLTTSYE